MLEELQFRINTQDRYFMSILISSENKSSAVFFLSVMR